MLIVYNFLFFLFVFLVPCPTCLSFRCKQTLYMVLQTVVPVMPHSISCPSIINVKIPNLFTLLVD